MTYVRATANLADKLAYGFLNKPINHEKFMSVDMRDFCDMKTGQDLTAHQLDRLTDMVDRRVRASLS